MFRQDFTCPALLRSSFTTRTGLSPHGPLSIVLFVEIVGTGLVRVRSPLLRVSVVVLSSGY